MSRRDEELKLTKAAVAAAKRIAAQAQKVVDGLIEAVRRAELKVLEVERYWDPVCTRCWKKRSLHGLQHRIEPLPKDPTKPIRCHNCKKVLYDPVTGLIPVVGECGVSKTKCKKFVEDMHAVCKETGHACDQYCPNA